MRFGIIIGIFLTGFVMGAGVIGGYFYYKYIKPFKDMFGNLQ